MFSKTCEYALQAILYVAKKKDTKAIGLKQIANSTDIPMHYLGKILQTLVKSKVLKSIKGPNGGFYLTKPAKDFTILQIVLLIDGQDVFDNCILGLKICSDKTQCPIHSEYKEIKRLLSKKTIEELILNDEEVPLPTTINQDI